MSKEPTPKLPADLEAEQVVLGNCILQQSVAPLGELTPEQFFSETHRKIAGALRALAEKHQPIDTVQLDRELTGSGVLPSELAALTDGVPSLTESSLAWYRERLNTLHQERLTLRAGYELGQAVSATEIRERAAEIVEKAKAPTAKHKKVYPEMPPEAWRGPAEFYRQGVGASTEASDNYHLAYFLTAVGALLGRTVYIRKGRRTYPNLYTVLVGKSGVARKGTAMDYALDLVRDIDSDVYITETVDSREGFILDLSTGQKDLEERRISGELRGALALEEFRSLIEKAEQKGVRNIIPTLCLLYDCPGTIANKSKNSPAKVNEPTISLFSGTSPSYLQNLSLGDIEGGMGNRICWVAGDAKPRKDDPPDPDASVLNPLKMAIKETLDFYRTRGVTRFYLSAEAAKRYKEFYHKEYNLETADELVSWLSERDHMTCLKVASIYAALDHVERDIELYHLEAGIAFVKFLYEARFPIFAGHGLSPAAQTDQKIIEKVRAAGAGGIGYRNLQKALPRVDTETFHRRMKSLAAPDSPLRLGMLGKKKWVFLAD